MARAQFLDKRRKPRKMLTGLLPGPITRKEGDRLNCKPVDISEKGLGIITSDLLKADEQVCLVLKDRKVFMSVSWSKPDFGKQNLVRYGLNLVDTSENLETIFSEAGCLK